MAIEIIPFEDEMLTAAAALLGRQQVRYRRLYPQLPVRFEDPDTAGEALATLWQGKHSDGFAAVEDGQLAAYLIGERMENDMIWGRCGWVFTPGCAYDDHVGVEVVRDLYAALGERWVARGIFYHLVLMPLGDSQLRQAWFSLSFGIEQVHGLIDLEEMRPLMPELPAGIEIRRAMPGDGAILAQLSDVIWKVQVETPVWAVMLPETAVETAEGWATLADDKDVTVWLAFVDGTAVGVQAYWAAEASSNKLFIPEQCVHLSVVGTRAEARGQGIGTLLTQIGLSQALEAGYRFCETDWRSTNLLASRFWPRRGFRPVVYRLARRVDPRTAWARG